MLYLLAIPTEQITFGWYAETIPVDRRYEILEPMGQGAYGAVVAAKDL